MALMTLSDIDADILVIISTVTLDNMAGNIVGNKKERYE